MRLHQTFVVARAARTRAYLRSVTALVRMLAENLLGMAHADAIRAVGLEYVHAAIVGLGTRPITLKFAHELERGDRYRADLNHPLHRPLVRLLRHVATRVGSDVNPVSRGAHLYGCKRDAHLSPHPGNHDLLAPRLVDQRESA
jgi:hypothetical protein